MKTVPVRPKKTPTSGLRRILVPTDFSRAAAEALCYAVPLSRQIGGKISLLHVLDWPVVLATLGAAITDEAKLTGAAKQALDDLARTTVPPALLEKTLVRVGRAYQDISESARGLRMDLIVIATQGRTGLKRALLGSTAERVVRHAACPVLTVRSVAGAKSPGLKSKSLAPRINRIPVPVDFSAASPDLVKYAVAFATQFRASLVLLHVVNHIRVTARVVHYATRLPMAVLEGGTRQLAEFAERLVSATIKAKEVVRAGTPYDVIRQVASREQANLIIIATRGHGAVKRLFIGSTAGRVVRHAPCPVLVVR